MKNICQVLKFSMAPFLPKFIDDIDVEIMKSQ